MCFMAHLRYHGPAKGTRAGPGHTSDCTHKYACTGLFRRVLTGTHYLFPPAPPQQLINRMGKSTVSV